MQRFNQNYGESYSSPKMFGIDILTIMCKYILLEGNYNEECSAEPRFGILATFLYSLYQQAYFKGKER
jgi:hypothetical protein